MVHDPGAPRAALICYAGALAGKTFEFEAEVIVGVDARNALVVGVDGARFARTHFRIIARERGHWLEPATIDEVVTVDGIALRSPFPLDNHHVIGIRGVSDFKYSRSVVHAQAAATPESADSARDTLMEMGGFNSIPKLTPKASPAVSRAIENNPQVPPSTDATTQPLTGRRDELKPGLELCLNVEGSGHVVYNLKFGDNIVGRGKDADIPILDPEKKLSRKHAIIRVSSERVELIDLDGANGTFVNGRRVSKAVISPGATFDLGPDVVLTLREKPRPRD